MKKNCKSLTVVLLMYNEAANIVPTLTETCTFLEEAVEDWEVLVVDDGSTDHSAELVREFMLCHSNVRLAKHDVNLGMGAGMITGIHEASKEYFIFNASDGQISPTEIGKMLHFINDADVVLTTYSTGRESVFRGVLSKGFRWYMRGVASLDPQVLPLQGLYLFPTAHAKEIVSLISADTFFFSFALIDQGISRGLTCTWTQIMCRPRVHGKSKMINWRKISKVASEAAKYGFKKRLRRL